MVEYKYFVSYCSSETNSLGFGNAYVMWGKELNSKEDIDAIGSTIKDDLVRLGKATPRRQVTIINYILMEIIPEQEND